MLCNRTFNVTTTFLLRIVLQQLCESYSEDYQSSQPSVALTRAFLDLGTSSMRVVSSRMHMHADHGVVVVAGGSG